MGGITGHGDAGRPQYELRIGTFVQGELVVVSYEGHEKLSSPYVYDVQFASSIPTQLLQLGLFGFPACLSIMTPTEPRVIQGLAVDFECVGAAEAELTTDTRRYATKIVPRVWLLNHNRKHRVFQNKSAVQIACAVLDAAGVAYKINLHREDYKPIPFVYQRGETDLEFLHHVLASAGIFYYFNHATGLLDELLPGAGAATALLGGLGGIGAAAGDLTGGISMGGSSIGGGIGGAAGGALGAVGGAVGKATSAIGGVAAAIGAITTLVLCDRAHHTRALHASALSVGLEGALGAGLDALGSPLSSWDRDVSSEGLGGASSGGLEALGSGAIDGFPSTILGGGLQDTIPYDGNGQAATEAERVLSFRLRKEVRPKSVAAQDWDLARSALLAHTSTSAAAQLDANASLSGMIGAAGLGFSIGATLDLNIDALPIAVKAVSVTEYQRDATHPAARASTSERALAQLRGDWIVGRGESDCRRLAAGYRFTLDRHPIAGVNTEYLIIEVHSSGTAPDEVPGSATPTFTSSFSCVPASVDPRPPKPGPRPRRGPETAAVVGPVYGDVHCDDLGRILVRFHWAAPPNRLSAETEEDDGVCWVHWVERWAGNGYGTLTLPRVGTNVLVDFLDDEGSAPIAVGQLYSYASSPPFALPGQAAKVGIRSRSIPAGPGYSEVSIDDTTDCVHIRAQANLSTDVLAHDQQSVGGDRRVNVTGSVIETVAGGRTHHVGGDVQTKIGGSVHSDTACDEVSSVGGNIETTVNGAVRRTIAGGVTEDVGGTVNVKVAEDVILDVQQAHTVHIGGHEIRTIGGDQSITVGAGAIPVECDISIHGTYTVSSTDAIVLEAEKSLVLRCGKTELRLTPESLALIARTIAASASKQLELSGSGPSLTFSDTMEFTGKKVVLQSSGARLELTDDAKLSGGKVQLGKGSGATSSAAGSDAKHKEISLSLLDEDDQPLANRTYHLHAGNLTLEGTTDDSGGLVAKVPDDAESARLTVWVGEFPEGRRITYVLDIGTLGDPHELAGAQKRLRNLGYYTGPLTGKMNHGTRDALLVFQLQRGLDTTGLLDDPTASALAELHP